MVVAVFAMIAALAGTGYAASKITGKDIKKDSVKGNRLKTNTVTGKQVNESKLGQVPSAADADTVGGMEMRQFTYAADNGSSGVTVLDFNGLKLKASCVSGANNGLTVTAASSNEGAHISFSSISQGGVVQGAAADPQNRANNNAYTSMPVNSDLAIYAPGGTTRTTNGPFSIGFANGQIVYSVPTTGEVISIDWTWNTNVAGNDCYWSGTAVGGTGGPVTAGASMDLGAGSSQSEKQRLARAR